MKTVIINSGAEEKAKQNLNRLGLKDRVDTNKLKSVTDYLESMTPEERIKYELETGQPWENLYNEQKNFKKI